MPHPAAAVREVPVDPVTVWLSNIRAFVWAVAARFVTVVPMSARRCADLAAVSGLVVWAVAFVSAASTSPLVLAAVAVLGPFCARRYLADRRLADAVARARTGMEAVRDARVELSLQISERVVAVEMAVLPLAVLEPTAAWMICSIVVFQVASIVVHADLPPAPSVWARLAERFAAVPDRASGWAPAVP